MPEYESPTVTELGTVAEFTRRDVLAFDFDGRFFRGPSDSGSGGGS